MLAEMMTATTDQASDEVFGLIVMVLIVVVALWAAVVWWRH